MILAIYFVGLAAMLLWGEHKIVKGHGSRGEQIAFAVGWPLFVPLLAGFASLFLLIEVSEAIDRRIA